MVHSKSMWWGTIPPVGSTGGQPVEEIRRRTPAPFLSEGEKEATWRERTANGYGELKLPLPVLIPTRSNRRGSTAYHRGSTARAEVPHRSGSTAPPGGSKKLLQGWKRQYRVVVAAVQAQESPTCISSTVAHHGSISCPIKCMFRQERNKRPLQHKRQEKGHTQRAQKDTTKP